MHLLARRNAVLSRLSVCSACALTSMLPICRIKLMVRRDKKTALIMSLLIFTDECVHYNLLIGGTPTRRYIGMKFGKAHPDSRTWALSGLHQTLESSHALTAS